MDKYFALIVKPGSVIHRANGIKQTLTEVPKNALEIWEEGSQTLCLRKDGSELIAEFTKERLENILELRRNINYKAEIKLLENAIKAAGTPKKPAQTDKE